VAEEIPPNWKVATRTTTMEAVDALYGVDVVDAVDANLEMDAKWMEEPPPPTPVRLLDEHLHLIFEL